MSTTAQNVYDMALARSKLNNSDLIDTAQVLQYITQAERKVYVRGARVNPDYFGAVGATAVRSAYTGTWNLAAKPGNVLAVTRVEIATITGTVTGLAAGTEVNLIRKTSPSLQVSPRAYLRGKIITGYSTELGDADANMVTSLNVYYSPMPAALTLLTQSVTLGDEWIDLLVLPLAAKLAMKDTRLDEVQLINQEYADAWSDFVEGVLVFDHGVKRSLSSVPAIPFQPSQGQ